MKNPFSGLSSARGSYLPVGQQAKGSSSSSWPNLPRRAWNAIILACLALSTIGVYLWFSTGGDKPGVDLGLDPSLDLDLNKDVDLGLDMDTDEKISELELDSDELSPTNEVLGSIELSEPEELLEPEMELESGPERFRLADLGQEAEDRYHLLGNRMDEYLSTLRSFLETALPSHTSSLLIPALSAYTLPYTHPDSHKPGMTEYKTIHQTDKLYDPKDKRIQMWKDMHRDSGWTSRFYDDRDALRWLRSKAGTGEAQEGDDELDVVDMTGMDVVEPEEAGQEELEEEEFADEAEDPDTDPLDTGFSLVEVDARTVLAASSDPETAERGVMWAWEYMKRGVMRADYFRYLVVLLEGGVYSDVDTYPLRPIDEWGKTKPEIYDISQTDGPVERWKSAVEASAPSVVIAVDVDVHEKMDWGKSWPRPLGICQWTLSGAPHHPIYVDAVRRVVNATQYIAQQIEVDLPEQIAALIEERPRGWKKRVRALERSIRTQQGILPIMEHTGPGLWTDAVFSYLLARYNITWHDLRGMDHPVRIGEVLVLPITAFSPGGQTDFHAKGRDDEQADVVHDFRGSWKSGGL